MTFTKAVVIVWTQQIWPPRPSTLSPPPPVISVSCAADLRAKLQLMITSEQTDGKGYAQGSPRISQFRFTDQAAAEEFVEYLNTVFPCPADIKSTAIINLHLSNPPATTF